MVSSQVTATLGFNVYRKAILTSALSPVLLTADIQVGMWQKGHCLRGRQQRSKEWGSASETAAALGIQTAPFL